MFKSIYIEHYSYAPSFVIGHWLRQGVHILSHFCPSSLINNPFTRALGDVRVLKKSL